MAHGCTYCTDDFHCEKFTNEKYTSWCYGKDYPCKDRRISNADRIRSMTDEELAKFITSGYYQPHCPVGSCPVVEDCEDCWLRWLKAEVEE